MKAVADQNICEACSQRAEFEVNSELSKRWKLSSSASSSNTVLIQMLLRVIPCDATRVKTKVSYPKYVDLLRRCMLFNKLSERRGLLRFPVRLQKVWSGTNLVIEFFHIPRPAPADRESTLLDLNYLAVCKSCQILFLRIFLGLPPKTNISSEIRELVLPRRLVDYKMCRMLMNNFGEMAYEVGITPKIFRMHMHVSLDENASFENTNALYRWRQKDTDTRCRD